MALESDSEARLPTVESWLCHLLTEWHWARNITTTTTITAAAGTPITNATNNNIYHHRILWVYTR